MADKPVKKVALKRIADNPWLSIQAMVQEQGLIVVGVDEAGRGPLFGPVVAGAVALNESFPLKGLACSKTLSEVKREQMFEALQQGPHICAVAQADVDEIDRLNILQASLLAMNRAVSTVIDRLVKEQAVDVSKVLVLVDGNKIPNWPFRAQAVVKGDVWVPAISAGSIMAKVTRDRWCREQASHYPQYELDRHMGYPTPRHLELLNMHGPSALHRKSFGPVRHLLENPQESLW